MYPIFYKLVYNYPELLTFQTKKLNAMAVIIKTKNAVVYSASAEQLIKEQKNRTMNALEKYLISLVYCYWWESGDINNISLIGKDM